MRALVGAGVALVGLGVAAAAGAVPIDVAGPTTGWTAIVYASNPPDFADDQATGQPEADIVGDLSNPAFYTAFDDAGTPASTDGTLGFRIRLGADANPAGFSKVAAVGIDANLDGALDVFLLVDNTGSPNQIAIYDAGSGANTSPSTTTISSTGVGYAETASNYDWSAVTATIDPTATSFDIDGDGAVDHFLSFAVPLQDLVNQLAAIGIANVDQNTPFQYVLGTSTQGNALNQDLGGPNGGSNSSSTWAALGATSNTYSAAGTPVPEPGAAQLLGLGLIGLGWAGRRR
jgi:hypothetical protein